MLIIDIRFDIKIKMPAQSFMIGPLCDFIPELLVDPAWVENRLSDPKLCVFDCTLTRVPQPDGASLWESGRAAFENAHIPGAAYLPQSLDDSAFLFHRGLLLNYLPLCL